jgi:tetratricopeptide (TPR) repeat protein
MDTALHNVGVDDPVYYKHRLRYAREFLEQFPDVDDNRYVNLRRAEGEALWNLGQRAEAEMVYEKLVERLPDEGWGYIGWSDHYWLWGAPEPKEYERAEAILKRALARPNLNDRDDALERLDMLYGEWGEPERRASDAAEAVNPIPKRQKRRRRKSKR